MERGESGLAGTFCSQAKCYSMWQQEPFKLELPAGQTAAVCRCGKTSNPPLCDGSHKGTEDRPEILRYDKDKTLWICGCGKSGAAPFCDGTHKK